MTDAPAKHPYHLVDPSPWPIMGAFSAFRFVPTGGDLSQRKLLSFHIGADQRQLCFGVVDETAERIDSVRKASHWSR